MAVERVGAYEILRVIARGGMATVYEARQPALDRAVALKRLDLRTDDRAAADRFIRESRIAGAFEHPNVVTVLDFFEYDGTPYIAMELLPRGSLRPWIGRLTLPQTFGVLEGVLAGLAHAESRGVAHRDLKPENVLVTNDGAVKIADFGIAKAYARETPALTETGMPLGTATYMAPEQATGGRVGPRTDLYAVGVMAYEMFSGRPPFEADTLVALLYQHVNERPPPLTGVDERVAAWVGWLLSKAPEARPPGAAAAWQALEDVVVDLLGPLWRRHAPLRGTRREPLGGAADVAAPTGDEAVTSAGHEATTPTGDEGVTTTGDEGVTTTGDEGVTTTGDEGVTTTGDEGVTTTGDEGVTTSGDEGVTTSGDEAVTAAVAAGAGATLAGGGAAAAPVAVGAAATRRAPAPPPVRRRRRGRLVAAASSALLVVVAAVVVVLVASSGGSPSSHGGRAGTPRAAAAGAPYDFDGDGSASVVAGLPAWPRGGAVALPASHEVLTASALGAPQGGSLGEALASADFDGDTRADLAVAGARAVVVVPGAAGGLEARAVRRIGDGAGALAAADLDGDGRGDLAVGGAGSIALHFGGPRGLGAARRTLPTPGPLRLLAAGDVDGDRRPDLVAATGDRVLLCPGAAGGPTSCHTLGRAAATALAVGDVTGDKVADILAGTPADGAGALVRWSGGDGGPARSPVRITQRRRGVPGNDQPGDEFGAALALADVDGDGTLDMLVGAPGEDDGAGRVTMIRGGPAGGGIAYGQDVAGVPGHKRAGHRFGAALTAAGAAGRTTLTVAAPGDSRGIVTLVLRPSGLPAPGATATAIRGATPARQAGLRLGG